MNGSGRKFANRSFELPGLPRRPVQSEPQYQVSAAPLLQDRKGAEPHYIQGGEGGGRILAENLLSRSEDPGLSRLAGCEASCLPTAPMATVDRLPPTPPVHDARQARQASEIRNRMVSEGRSTCSHAYVVPSKYYFGMQSR